MRAASPRPPNPWLPCDNRCRLGHKHQCYPDRHLLPRNLGPASIQSSPGGGSQVCGLRKENVWVSRELKGVLAIFRGGVRISPSLSCKADFSFFVFGSGVKSWSLDPSSWILPCPYVNLSLKSVNIAMWGTCFCFFPTWFSKHPLSISLTFNSLVNSQGNCRYVFVHLVVLRKW